MWRILFQPLRTSMKVALPFPPLCRVFRSARGVLVAAAAVKGWLLIVAEHGTALRAVLVMKISGCFA